MDGRLIGVDNAVTKDYMSVLKRFAELSTISSKSSDQEFRNRSVSKLVIIHGY